MRYGIVLATLFVTGFGLLSNAALAEVSFDLDLTPTSGPPGTIVRIKQTGTCGETPIASNATHDVYFRDVLIATLPLGPYCPGLAGFWLTDTTFTVPASAAPGPASVDFNSCRVECGINYHWTFTVTSGPSPSPSPSPAPSPAPTPDPDSPYPPLCPPGSGDTCPGAPQFPKDTSCPAVPDWPPEAKDTEGRNLAVVIHGWNGYGRFYSRNVLHQDLEALARKIKSESGPTWDVVFYDWRDYAAGYTPPPLPPDPGLAVEQARRIGTECLGRDLQALDYDHVHLIAHSAGIWLAAGAAKSASFTGGPEIHLSGLDAYVPLGGEVAVASKYRHTIGDGTTLFDNYYNTGILDGSIWTHHSFTKACNVDVTPGGPNLGPHGQPIAWYGDTVGASNGRGFPLAKEATGKPWPDPANPCRQGSLTKDGAGAPQEGKPGKKEMALPAEFCKALKGISLTGKVSLPGCTKAKLETASPTWLVMDVDVPQGANVLEMTLDFQSPQPGSGWFQVVLDGAVVAISDEQASTTDAFVLSIELGVELDGGTHELALRLDNLTSRDSTLEVSDLRFGTVTEVVDPRQAPLPPNTGTGANNADGTRWASLAIGIGLMLTAVTSALLRRRKH